MVFDVVKLRPKISLGDAEYTCQFVAQVSHFRCVREPIFGLAKHAESRGGVQDLFV